MRLPRGYGRRQPAGSISERPVGEPVGVAGPSLGFSRAVISSPIVESRSSRALIAQRSFWSLGPGFEGNGRP